MKIKMTKVTIIKKPYYKMYYLCKDTKINTFFFIHSSIIHFICFLNKWHYNVYNELQIIIFNVFNYIFLNILLEIKHKHF